MVAETQCLANAAECSHNPAASSFELNYCQLRQTE